MIEVKNISYKYTKNNYALQNVSFTINKGEWVSIIGHNGSGKSTISKIIVGLIEPNEGEVYIDDIKVSEENLGTIRKKIGIVFSNPDNQFVGVTVKHDIAFGLENREVKRSKMLELIDEYSKKTGVSHLLDKEPISLSGGEKQRVALAGILAVNCEYIILDEALSMLDPTGVKDMIDIIKNLNKNDNITVITITHNLHLASLSDKIIVMNEGNVALVDTPDKIFKQTSILNQAKLDIPFNLKLYNEALKNEKIKENSEVIDALCSLSLIR